jgi:hypothetical protein
MTLGMHAAHRQVSIEYVFAEGLDALPKLVKTGERIVWFDYGTNLDQDSIPRVFNTMEKDIRAVVFPSVIEGVDWDMFRKKTVEGSTEPIHQRALTFDTDVAKKVVGTDLYDVVKTSARVWVMDSKPIDKKLKSVQKNLSCDSYESLFAQLKSNNLRVVALPSATVIRHFTHKCLGNILEMPGVMMNP